MPEFISTTQAAQRMGLTREQVLRRIGRGAVTAQYVGGRWLVEESSVEEYVRREAAAHGLSLQPERGRGEDLGDADDAD